MCSRWSARFGDGPRGGKNLLVEQVLQGGLQGGLVAFDGHQVISPFLIQDELPGFHLGMQRVREHDLAAQIQPAEQLPGGGDLVAFVRGQQPAQILPFAIDGVDHLHAAVAHLLAVHNDQVVLNGPGQPLLPAQENAFQQRAATAALFKVPADESVAILDVEGRAAPGDHPEPSALIGDCIAQMFAHQGGIVQIVMLDDELITSGDIRGAGQQPDLCVFENVLFVIGQWPSFWFSHPRRVKKWEGNVPQKETSLYLSTPRPRTKTRPGTARLPCGYFFVMHPNHAGSDAFKFVIDKPRAAGQPSRIQ